METLRFLKSLFVAATLFLLSSPLQAQNYSDIWWNPLESGWGMTLAHHNEQIFGVLYIYDIDGRPLWLTMPGGTFSENRTVFSGDLWKTVGSPVGISPWNSARVASTKVGAISLRFSSSDSAVMTYSIGGFTTTKQIVRQVFGNWPVTYGLDSTDLYWNPDESGWGVSVIQHGETAFAVAFVHDPNGQPTWLVGPNANLVF